MAMDMIKYQFGWEGKRGEGGVGQMINGGGFGGGLAV